MHKLAKGLKKKKKPKKGKKGAEEEEFDPEELERYRRERAEAQQKAEEAGEAAKGTGSDEWKKFQALTAGVDSVLRKTQDDLDRIKSTSFFQRKAPLEEKKPDEAAKQEDKSSSKRWVGFDKEGNPIEAAPEIDGQERKEGKPFVNEDGFVEVPEDEDEQEDSADEDIFDTTYVDVLQNIDVQLAYIPDSPTEEEAGDDPFDTTNADKVLRTVDKKGNKLVSLGNAVEVLSGRIDYVSTCKITKGRRPRIQQDLLLDDFDEAEQPSAEAVAAEPTEVEKTLLDDDSDLPDIPVDLTKLPPVFPRPVSPVTPTPVQESTTSTTTEKTSNGPLDISEFEVLKEKTVLEEIPDLDDAEFDLNVTPNESTRLEEADDPFAAKEPETTDFQTEIIEASFEAATFVDEADPFDTTFADNILPGKTELKFIEKELEELPVSEVSISLTDPAGLIRDYETGRLKTHRDTLQKDNHDTLLSSKKDLLGGSTTDLSQLADEPIAPVEEITYVDPFDTSAVKELPPGKTELKVLEKELLGEQSSSYVEDDSDFDPRKDEESVKILPAKPPPLRPSAPVNPVFDVNFEEDEKIEAAPTNFERKASRPEVLELAPIKTVAFELPTPSKRPDLLATSEEEKTLPSKPLTPYYSQKSIEESLPIEDDEVDVDPFDTSFVNNVAPGKTELKLIESELLRQESKLPHSLSDHDFDPRSTAEPIRRQSDFTATSVAPSNLKLAQLQSSLIQKVEEEVIVKRKPQRQESLLDAEVEVDAKPLTPRIESKPIAEEEEILYLDPFDTSIATNILPGKAELKILESELQQIPQQPPPRPNLPINLPTVVPVVASTVPEIDDFDPRADEVKESKDFLFLDGQDTGDKVLTPMQNKDFTLDDDVDPFDTSFATIEPGRTELKLLESELMKCAPNSIMDPKGGNPFLMDDYAAEPGGGLPPQASNPFLQDFTDSASSGAGENPFLNFSSGQTYEPPVSVDSTNPFASFGIESTAPDTGFGATTDTNTPATDVFTSQSSNIFVTSENASVDLFGTMTTTTAEKQPATVVSPPQPSPAATPPSRNGKPPPSRPPPPRPQPPPIPPPVQPASKNTKDLILSVTGAMDATSNHLLDRLQATRTPSPTLMHSPSPTPEHSFADLLDVDSNVPDLISDDKVIEPPKNQDIMDLFDAHTDVTSTYIFSTSITTTGTTSLVTGAPITATTTKDNPFASMSEEAVVPQAQAAFDMEYPEDIISSEKRPSMTSATPFAAIETDVEKSGTVLDLAEPAPVQPVSTATAELFQETEQISTAADANFFSMTDTTTATPFGVAETTPAAAPFAPAAQPLFAPSEITQPAFASDLLGDFGETTKEISSGLISTSPTPGTEFPGNEAYRPEEELDNFAATTKAIEDTGDSFDAFASKFDKAAEPETNGKDPFLDPFGGGPTAMDTSSDVWGDSSVGGSAITGFGESDGFDSFLSMTAPPPDTKVKRSESAESDEGPDFSVFIKPKEGDQMTTTEGGPVPTLAPPPKSPQIAAYTDSSPRFNPFDKSGIAQDAVVSETAQTAEMARTDSQETPPTPLFDEDVSQPLEDFPRITYTGDGWEMQLRQPNKKKITGQRFWKKIFVKLVYQGDNPILHLSNNKDDRDPFQELPLLACYSVSDIGAQQFDQYGKIFTVKLQYIFYKERPGVRPGQVTKAERITNKLSQFAAYAIQGDYQGVKEFGSDLKKLGLPVEHAPQISQLFKLGSQCYEDMKQFSCAIEEALFRLSAHRDRALHYKMEEVQVTVVDEVYVEQNAEGHVDKQIARVRLFFLGFLSGMPDIELGINDMWRQGKEVVGRHDIIPVVTEEWIRLENVEFHSCVQQDEYEKSRIIKFKPPDACYIELMRFRVRPPKNRELPLQLKAVMCVTGNKVELRADILVPGFASRKLGQIPCEDVMVRFPIPECWIYLFRVEKHFRYGSVKSAHRRTGKIKGIERFLGAVDTLEPQLMEVTSGQAKYEHQHRAIVWRMPRLPKEGQGAYTTHQLVCRMALTSYDQIPENLSEYCYVEFTMPATQVSHTTARSVSLQNSDSDAPPEKYVRNLSRHEYRVGIEHTQGEGPGAYVAATIAKKIPETTPEVQETPEAPADSDSDSTE
ncbi:protein stoned-B-like [Temnothorax curvispinosus]|uniref:Protein stoned-B-like n=1 Tax=Temnothorax curvispinosus TaxID=300111 RepID=A0A6J1PKE7_9HYME|nr:protein stoned-B-like [Temnothorax curvispinosus]